MDLSSKYALFHTHAHICQDRICFHYLIMHANIVSDWLCFQLHYHSIMCTGLIVLCVCSNTTCTTTLDSPHAVQSNIVQCQVCEISVTEDSLDM